jgi:hypothetical protein
MIAYHGDTLPFHALSQSDQREFLQAPSQSLSLTFLARLLGIPHMSFEEHAWCGALIS